jgi:hypothetical protein
MGGASGIGLEPYRRCDQNLGSADNPGCDANAHCSGGVCVFECLDNLSLATGTGAECPLPLSGTATRTCAVLVCALQCADGKTCPSGMTCDSSAQRCQWP